MTAPADVAVTGLTELDVRARTDAGQVNMVWPGTRSWISIARRSDGQTPRNAYRGGSSSSSVTSSRPRCARPTTAAPAAVQEPLPALRPGRVAEGHVVAPTAQPVAAQLELDTPAERQLRGQGELPQDHGIVLDGRTDHVVPVGHERPVQGAEPVDIDERGEGFAVAVAMTPGPFGVDVLLVPPPSVSGTGGHGTSLLAGGSFVLSW